MNEDGNHAVPDRSLAMGALHAFYHLLHAPDSDQQTLRIATLSSPADTGLSVSDIGMLMHQRPGVEAQMNEMIQRLQAPKGFHDFERWRQLEACQTCNTCAKAWDCRVLLDDDDIALPKGFCPNEATFLDA